MTSDRVLLAHGSGGRLSHELVERVFVARFSNTFLAGLDDAAMLWFTASECRLAFTTDSYVVSPIVFPGGDIGKLAVCGTINDLSMMGARPLYLSTGWIIEEGLTFEELESIADSMAEMARDSGVRIVAGDTKVVDRGHADKLFINTAGIGIVPEGVEIAGANARPGDVVLISGTVGDHGMAILVQREGLSFSLPLVSDCAPLNGLVEAMLGASDAIHCLRDPTRGGLATALNELAVSSDVGIEIDESSVPVRDAVRAACELLGLDPFYVANEGKLVAVVAERDADAVLTEMRSHPLGGDAAIIGRVTAEHSRRVVLRTPLGARRILDMLTGDQLPRIC